MTKSYFVTATGTNIGKTFVTCALLQTLRAQGYRTSAVKPVLSGVGDTSEPNDAERLAAALEVKEPLSLVHTTYDEPLSPDMAARISGDDEVSFQDIIDFCAPPDTSDYHFVEGIGGTHVPLSSSHMVIDLIEALNYPTILVCGHYLGSLSHTLSALESLTNVHGIIVCDKGETEFPLEQTVVSLQNHTDVPILALPYCVNEVTTELVGELTDFVA